jgi:hypothetical protein
VDDRAATKAQIELVVEHLAVSWVVVSVKDAQLQRGWAARTAFRRSQCRAAKFPWRRCAVRRPFADLAHALAVCRPAQHAAA